MASRPRRLNFCLALVLTSGLFPLSSVAAQPPVAGLAPDRRPTEAPIVVQGPVQEIDSKGLRGIAQPLPTGLGFMTSQGAWYTPFTQPGMTGPYDIRGWHGSPAKR